MTHWLVSGWPELGGVALKACLMYVTALLGLRVAHRRTLAQWTAIDFAAAVAVGAIVGRTAVAQNQSLVVGVVALLTVLLAHGLATYARYLPWFARVTDHRVRILVERGQLRRRELLVCGITDDDLYSELRRRGVYGLQELRYVLYEPKGELTIVREGAGVHDADVLARGLREALDVGGSATDEDT